MSQILDDLIRNLELEGYKPDTEAFDVALRERRVIKCIEMQGVPSCGVCRAFMGCELVKEHRRDIAFGRRKKKADVIMNLQKKPPEVEKPT